MNQFNYPIYRKLRNGNEFLKLNSDGLMIIVKRSPFRKTGSSFAIVHADNPLMATPFNDDASAADATRDEFEKAYGQAQYQLSKTNCEQ